MKKLITLVPSRSSQSVGSRRFFFFLAIAFLAGVPLLQSRAANLKEARVSQVVRDVKLLQEQAAPRPAAVSDQVRDNTAVRTGTDSRAELTFTDQTLARLGANTIFSFKHDTRTLELGDGAMLLRVPKNSGGAQITTAAVTAAITGTTVMLEYHPNAYIKFIVLEGTGRVFRKDRVGESVLINAGQMLIVNPKGHTLPDPVHVDLKRLVKTSHLITDFKPVPSLNLILRAIADQTAEKGQGRLLDTNLVIFGSGTAVSLLDATRSDVLDQSENSSRGLEGGSSSETEPTPRPSTTPRATPTPTPRATPTPTASPTPPVTPTPSATPSPTVSPTPTATPSATPTPTLSPTPTPTPPGATTATYNGGTDTWSNPGSWSQNVVPNNGNNGVDYDAFISSGTLTQDIVAGVTINQLFMSGGTLILANPLTLEAGLQFSGGSITSGTLNVAGTSTQSALIGTGGTTINNSGTYNLTLTSGDLFSGTDSVFNNSGTVVRSAGTGSTTFNLALNNTGIFSVESGTLTLLGVNPVMNSAILQAANGGTLILSGGTFTNTGGTIQALDNSFVQLTDSSNIVGGTLSTTGSGVIQANSAANTSVFLTNLTNAGTFVGINDSDITLSGNITNLGSITSAPSPGTVADIIIQTGGVILDGGGTVTLSSANDGLRAARPGVRLTNVDNLIQGQGLLGQNDTAFTNQGAGVISANVNGATLTIDPVPEGSGVGIGAPFLNKGTLLATDGGILVLSGNGGGSFTSPGTIEASNGGSLQLTGTLASSGLVDVGDNSLTITDGGRYTQTAGTFRVAGGTVTSSTALSFTGGLVDARGTITAALTSGATLQPALGGTGLDVVGNVTLLTASRLTFQLGGLTQGNQYGFLNVNGTVALNGQLVVSFVNSFQAGNSDAFTVLSSTALSGVFSNVPSGSRITVTDGSGTFLVTYGDNNEVVLSDFQSTPHLRRPFPNETKKGAAPKPLERKSPNRRGPTASTSLTRLRNRVAMQSTDELRDLMDGSTTLALNGTLVVARKSSAVAGRTSSRSPAIAHESSEENFPHASDKRRGTSLAPRPR